MRVDEGQPWKPFLLFQPLTNLVNACFFQYGIAFYDVEIGSTSGPYPQGRVPHPVKGSCVRSAGTPRATTFCTHCCPASALTTLTANLTANLVRNLWTHSVIMCGTSRRRRDLREDLHRG